MSINMVAVVVSLFGIFGFYFLKMVLARFKDLLYEKNQIQMDLIQLEEEIFLLKNKIKFNNKNNKITYDVIKPSVHGIYHVEIQYFPLFDTNESQLRYFHTQIIDVNVFLKGKLVKELKIHKDFFSISEIYQYLELEIKEISSNKYIFEKCLRDNLKNFEKINLDKR